MNNRNKVVLLINEKKSSFPIIKISIISKAITINTIIIMLITKTINMRQSKFSRALLSKCSKKWLKILNF